MCCKRRKLNKKLAFFLFPTPQIHYGNDLYSLKHNHWLLLSEILLPSCCGSCVQSIFTSSQGIWGTNLLYSRNIFQLSQAYLPEKYFLSAESYLSLALHVDAFQEPICNLRLELWPNQWEGRLQSHLSGRIISGGQICLTAFSHLLFFYDTVISFSIDPVSEWLNRQQCLVAFI